MTEQEQIDALKAQVNRLREVIVKHTPVQIGKNGYELLDEVMGVLDSTPEQCLAEVKANAIEEYKREQAEMKQMELATKIMISSI